VQNYEAEGGTLWNKKFVTPEIPGVVKGGTLVSVVREGFQGTEGPVVLKDGSILFTENRADRIVKIAANGDISTYLEKTGGANALAVAADGALYGVLTAAAPRAWCSLSRPEGHHHWAEGRAFCAAQ
jgi:gluconolactonase